MKTVPIALLLLLGACSSAAPRSAEQRQQDSTTIACRADVERTVRYRDRGQTMRNDEADSRMGAGSYRDGLSGSMSTERLSARFEQDRMIDDCVRGANNAVPAPRTGAGPGS
jgi:hypothetical protein